MAPTFQSHMVELQIHSTFAKHEFGIDNKLVISISCKENNSHPLPPKQARKRETKQKTSVIKNRISNTNYHNNNNKRETKD